MSGPLNPQHLVGIAPLTGTTDSRRVLVCPVEAPMRGVLGLHKQPLGHTQPKAPPRLMSPPRVVTPVVDAFLCK